MGRGIFARKLALPDIGLSRTFAGRAIAPKRRRVDEMGRGGRKRGGRLGVLWMVLFIF